MIAGGLNAGVELVQTAAGCEPHWKLRRQLIYGRIVFHWHEGNRGTRYRPFPQTAVEIKLTGMVLVIARPLQAFECFQSRVTHAGVNGTERPNFIPDIFCDGLTPVVPHPAGKVKKDGNVVARSCRRIKRLPHPLHSSLAVGNRTFAFAPSRGNG